MHSHCALLRGGSLTALVGDDTARGPGGQQYSGIWALWDTACAFSPFQSAHAGFIASAHRGTGPRLEAIDAQTARLVKEATVDTGGIQTTGTYRLTAPHYVDYTFEVSFADDGGPWENPVQFSWCSYMNSPLDSSIHFIEQGVWTTLTPVIHGEAATVFPAGLTPDRRAGWERREGEARFREQGQAFYRSFSGRTFDYPFYYGMVHDMCWLFMADHHQDLRFFISPAGAGFSAIPGHMSPAWDWLWHVWDPRPGETRTLHARLAWFRPTGAGLLPPAVWREWETFRAEFPLRDAAG